jgi:CHRD domain-containing protein
MTRLSVVILTLFAAIACGGSNGPAAATSPKPAATFTMGSMGGSGVTGVGQVYKQTGSFTVSIQIKGLAANSSHVSHVHIGTCAKPGSVAYALIQVVADASGNATATTTVAEYYSMPATGWYVNVHRGPDFSEAEYAPSVSCGDLPQA